MHKPQEGYCLIYEDGRPAPIGELKQSEAENAVKNLWEKYGHRFNRSNPKSRPTHTRNGRLEKPIWAIPVHAKRDDSDKTLCGGSPTALADPTSDLITCEFCLSEIQSHNSKPTQI